MWEHSASHFSSAVSHISQALAMSMDVDAPDAATTSAPPAAAAPAADGSAPPVAATPAPTAGPVPTPSAPQRAPEPPAAAATPEQQPLLGGERRHPVAPVERACYCSKMCSPSVPFQVECCCQRPALRPALTQQWQVWCCGHTSVALAAGDADMGEDVEDPELMAALAMSMSDFAGGSATAPAAPEAATASTPVPATSTPQVCACAVLAEHGPLLAEVRCIFRSHWPPQ